MESMMAQAPTAHKSLNEIGPGEVDDEEVSNPLEGKMLKESVREVGTFPTQEETVCVSRSIWTV